MKKQLIHLLRNVLTEARTGSGSGSGSFYVIFIIAAICAMSIALVGGEVPSIRGVRPMYEPVPNKVNIRQGTNTSLQQELTISPSVSPSF